MNPTAPEPEPDIGTPTEHMEELEEMEDFLKSHGSFLETLHIKVTESRVKNRVLVCENLQWDILREAGNLSWFSFTLKMVGCIKKWPPKNIPYSKDKVLALQQQVEAIGEQIDELNLSLEADSEIFKIAAGTLLYNVAVIKYIERKAGKSQTCCSPMKSWLLRKSLSDRVPHLLDEVLGELKVLQDSLMFATLAAVGNRVSQSIIRHAPMLETTPIGVDHHVHEIITHIQKAGVCLVGIHGHAGVGKTTLLNEVVATVQHTQKRLFASVEVDERPNDLRRMQASLLQQLGGGKKEFSSSAQGRNALLYQLHKLKHNMV